MILSVPSNAIVKTKVFENRNPCLMVINKMTTTKIYTHPPLNIKWLTSKNVFQNIKLEKKKRIPEWLLNYF